MPIPGDNGHPRKERDQQNLRIKQVAEKGACVRQEVVLNAPVPKTKSIFGEI